MEIVPGIHRFELPIPFAMPGEEIQMVGETNVYLIRRTDGWLLVDAGLDAPETLETLEQSLAEIGASVTEIHQIVATHFHHDHLGLAGKLRDRSGAEVALHRDDLPFIDMLGAGAEQTLRESRDWFCENGAPKKELPIFADWGELRAPDTILSGGERISTGYFDFEVMWTPGHSPGHVCLYERDKKLLLSGDHILEDISSEVGGAPGYQDNPLADYLNCLHTSRDLDVELVLPAHGSPFTRYRERVDELIEHHRERAESILQILEAGPAQVYQIATQVIWIPQLGGIPWEKLDLQNRRMAFLETWAHLRLLESEGRVGQFAEDGSVFYSTTKAAS